YIGSDDEPIGLHLEAVGSQENFEGGVRVQVHGSVPGAGAAPAPSQPHVSSGEEKLTSTCSDSTRSSISADEVSARLSVSSRSSEKKLRGHSWRLRTTLTSAAKIVSWAPR